jgi:hypothetical protein
VKMIPTLGGNSRGVPTGCAECRMERRGDHGSGGKKGVRVVRVFVRRVGLQ